MPEGMEGGTPNLPGIAALGAALDFIDELGIDRIAAHSQALTSFLITRLREIPHPTLLPGVAWGDCAAGYGIVSFRLEGVRSDDLGFALSAHAAVPGRPGHQRDLRVSWNDSERIPNVAHVGPSSLGAAVPIAAREATIALWQALAADEALAARAAARGRSCALTPGGAWRTG